MKKIILLSVALLLTGCATQFGERISSVVSTVSNFSITQGQVDSARNSYDGFVLALLTKYSALPRCKSNQTLTLNNTCHDRKLLKQLREADKAVAEAFTKTQDSITSGDNTGAVAAYNSLTIAIDLAKSLINQTGISVLGF